jgi:hypothetical protein
MQRHIFQFASELADLQNTTPLAPSSHCSSVQERLVNYGSEALDTVEHLGLILKDQNKALTLLNHFGSIVINGGAAVAILAYLGSLASRNSAAHRGSPPQRY